MKNGEYICSVAHTQAYTALRIARGRFPPTWHLADAIHHLADAILFQFRMLPRISIDHL